LLLGREVSIGRAQTEKSKEGRKGKSNEGKGAHSLLLGERGRLKGNPPELQGSGKSVDPSWKKGY